MQRAAIPSEYDVAIVGAGPTGLVLANLLGAAALRVLLVEANDSTVSEPRAVSIDDESLRVVQQLGLLETVEREIVRGYGSEYRSPAGAIFLKVKPLAEPYGHPRRNAFRQPVFEMQLREGLARYPSVETRFRCRAEGFDQDEDGVALRLVPDTGPPETVRASFLVGCDGARSALREQLGFVLEGSSLDERWLILDLAASPSNSKETIVYCDPRRPGIALPGPRDTRRYEFKLMRGETDEQMLSDESVRSLLANHGAVAGSSLVRQTVYHFHARIADHWGRGRVWLAGDAAHLMPPFAGQGMNSGVRDAHNIAWKLVEILRGRIGPRLLESYERERRGHVGDMIRLARRMGTIMGPRSRFHGFVTRSIFRCLGLWPAARSYFAEMKYKPAPRFDRGFLISSMLTRRGRVGRMIPQPRLRTGAGCNRRLDELIGPGFALLGVGLRQETVEAISLGTIWDGIVDQRLAVSVTEAPELKADDGMVLLLRPDRYVMASFFPQDADRAIGLLDELWADSWPIADDAKGELRI